MDKRTLSSCLLAALFLGAGLGMRLVGSHHESSLWLIYYAGWVGFAIWFFSQPKPANSKFHFSLWPIWARAVWGILTSIAVVRLIHFIVG
jgi:hypothetical protein